MSFVKFNKKRFWNEIKTCLTNLMDKHIPTKTFKPRFDVPWIGRDVKRVIRKKNRLFKKAKKSKCWDNFRKCRRELQYLLRKARNDHLENVVGVNLENGNQKPF